MKIAICGMSGFIGKELRRFFTANNYQVIPITRKDLKLSVCRLAAQLDGCKIIINLAGAPILHKWTEAYKLELKRSRVETTNKLVEVINAMVYKPELFISASAVGIYDSYEVHDEFSTHYAKDFLSEVCQEWEAEALKLNTDKYTRLCIIRLGVVLGNRGGAFPKMIAPFKWGVGGRIGMGHQVFPFIHVKDLMAGVWYLIQRHECFGVYNFVAPVMASNEEFTLAVSARLKRPAFFRVPEQILKMIFGEGSDVLAKGQKVIPFRLQNEGFVFSFPDIEKTLDELLRKQKTEHK